MHRQVHLECDVAVIGGGPGGLSTAIAAAREGAKVILVERSAALGGAAASGLGILGYIDRGGHKALGGLAQEYVDRLVAKRGSLGHDRCPVHNSITAISPDRFKIMAMELCREAGVQVIFGCELLDVMLENRKIAGVRAYGKCTEIDIKAKLYADGTGDGDLAFMAGVPFVTGQDGTGVCQPSTLMFTVTDFDLEKFYAFLEAHPEEVGIKEDYAKGYDIPFFRKTPSHCLIGLGRMIERARAAGDFDVPRNQFIYIKTAHPALLAINTVRVTNIDASDPLELSKGLAEGYRQIGVLMDFMNKYVPGFETAVIAQISPALGIRETRHFKARTRLTKESMYAYRTDGETIALCAYNVDIHSGTADHIDLGLLQKPFGMPYGCMVPEGVDNLLLTGRTIDVDTEVFAAARVMGPIIAMGEAAGVAAAQCVREGRQPADVDVKRVRETLLSHGAILEV
jgi:hypothetical protein